MQDTTSSDEQADHDPAIQGFFLYINNNLIAGYSNPTTDERRNFVPIKLAGKYLSDNRCRKLNNILAALFPGQVPPVDADHIIRNYLRVFCILVWIGKGRYIRQFTSYEVLSDTHLCFDPESRPRYFPHAANDFYDRFCQEQWKFCVPVLQHNVTDLHLEADTILPIIHKQQLAVGGSAVLHQITLHAAYDELRRPESPRPSNAERYAHTFVLKTYTSKDAETYYNNEVNAFRQLRTSGTNSDIIGFYGSYIKGDTFNIILEFADKGSLPRYFKEHTPPSSGSDIIKFWSSLFKVIKALINIHDVEPRGIEYGPQIFQGWHQDVKPQNLLVVGDPTKSPYEWQIKLADLGISHFSSKSISHQDTTTRDAHGTRTYGAPESHRSNEFIDRFGLKVSQKVDIWSLGCIYSEAAVWVVLGPGGVEHYRQARKVETEQKKPTLSGGDCFHDGEKVLDAVVGMHRHLQSQIRNGDHITWKILERMVMEMLVPWRVRPDAQQLWHKAELILAEATTKLAGASWEDPFPHTGLVNGSFPITNGKPREPSNVLSPPWEVPPLSRPETWGGPSSSKARNMALMPISIPDGGYGACGTKSLSRQNSVNLETSHDSLYKSMKTSAPPALYLNQEEMEENEPFDQAVPPWSSIGSRIPTMPKEAAHEGLYHETISNSPLNRLELVKGKGRSDTDHFSRRSTSEGLSGQLGGPFTSPPAHALNTSAQVSSYTRIPHMTYTQALAFKISKKNKTATYKDLPYSDLLYRLIERDHVFLIDNSATMKPYWKQMTDLFAVLAWLIKDSDPDGIEIYFTVSNGQPTKARNTTALLAALNAQIQGGVTDINLSVSRILEKYQSDLKDPKKTTSPWRTAFRGSKKIRPMNLYVLTDGRWEPPADAQTPIQNLVKTLDDLKMQRKQVGIQFISFGNDPNGLQLMQYLDDSLGLPLDIVDTEPSDGNIWKMLLGAINPMFDNNGSNRESLISPTSSPPPKPTRPTDRPYSSSFA